MRTRYALYQITAARQQGDGGYDMLQHKGKAFGSASEKRSALLNFQDQTEKRRENNKHAAGKKQARGEGECVTFLGGSVFSHNHTNYHFMCKIHGIGIKRPFYFIISGMVGKIKLKILGNKVETDANKLSKRELNVNILHKNPRISSKYPHL